MEDASNITAASRAQTIIAGAASQGKAVCSLCSKECGQPSGPELAAAEESDPFVLLDTYGAPPSSGWNNGASSSTSSIVSESDAAHTLVLLESLGAPREVNNALGTMSESVRRQRRLRKRALVKNDAGSCARCADAMRALLEQQLASARHEAELYARCDRQMAASREEEDMARTEAESTRRKRTSRRKASAEALARNTTTMSVEDEELLALKAALSTARREARNTRTALHAARVACSDLDGEEGEFDWRQKCEMELELRAFRDGCAGLVSKAHRRHADDAVVEGLANALATIDQERSSFELIDAYLRAASKELANIIPHHQQQDHHRT